MKFSHDYQITIILLYNIIVILGENAAAAENMRYESGTSRYSATISCRISEINSKISSFYFDRAIVLDSPQWADQHGFDKYGSYVRVKNTDELFRPFYINSYEKNKNSGSVYKTLWVCTTEAYGEQVSKFVSSNLSDMILKIGIKSSSTTSLSHVRNSEVVKILDDINSNYRKNELPSSSSSIIRSLEPARGSSNSARPDFSIPTRDEFIHMIKNYSDSEILAIISNNTSNEFWYPCLIPVDKFGLRGFVGNVHEMILSDSDIDTKRYCAGGDVYSRAVDDIRKIYEFPDQQRLFNVGFRFHIREIMPSNFKFNVIDEEIPSEIVKNLIFSECQGLKIFVNTRIYEENNAGSASSALKVVAFDCTNPPINHKIRLLNTSSLLNIYLNNKSYPPKRLIYESLLLDYIKSAILSANELPDKWEINNSGINVYTENVIVFGVEGNNGQQIRR